MLRVWLHSSIVNFNALQLFSGSRQLHAVIERRDGRDSGGHRSNFQRSVSSGIAKSELEALVLG